MKRRGATLLVAAGLLFVAWIGWRQASQGRHESGDAAQPVPGTSTTAGSPPGAASAAPVLATLLPASASRPGPQPPSGAETVDMCGLGPVPAATFKAQPPGNAPQLPRHIGEYAVDAAREQLLRALAAGPPRWRGAATLMQGRAPGAAQSLARDALGAGDPLMLRWAIARCEDRNCSQPLAARWVEVEPGNAVAWLSLLDAAPQQRERALAGLRQASAFRSGWAHLAAIEQEAMPAAVLPYVQAQLVVEAIGIEAALRDPTMLLLSGLCRAPWGDAKTMSREDCDALARLMVERGDTLQALLTATSIGKRLGWPAERLESLGREAEVAMREIPAINLENEENPFSCRAVQARHEWVREVARDGERAALRARLPASAPR